MMHLKTNFVVPSNTREFEDSEVETMTEKQFDELPLCDQISIYNNHRAEYDRLTGRATEDATATEDTRTKAQRFADTFEQRVDAIITRAIHGDNR